MIVPRPGDLFACEWEADEDEPVASFRIVEVADVTDAGYLVWLYGDRYASIPAGVDPSGLRRVQGHEVVGGPFAVAREEFAAWVARPVSRLDTARS